MSAALTVGTVERDLVEMLHSEVLQHQQAVDELTGAIERSFVEALGLLENSLRNGGKLLIFGNGGSAGYEQHIAAELTIRYKNDRPAIAAIALTTDSSALTACGNDFGFERLFARQVEALVRTGDAVMGISTSGRSPNVLAGLAEAKKREAHTIGLTGSVGDKMRQICDSVIAVPSDVTARIQEMHILVGHMLCKALERRLGLA
jgi:D-sedoheptulose 7-phosphate isomerase